MTDKLFYLDNAATTFPKPSAVCDECFRCIKDYCGNPGRGSHYYSEKSSEKLFEARELLCSLFGCSSPENVVFTLNTTYALNFAIKTFARDGDSILISDMEHNSVVRPVEALKHTKNISYSVFTTFKGDDRKTLSHINSLIKPNTKILVCQHSSNICGIVQPIKKIGELCRKKGILFIVDAAQSAGIFDIDMQAMCIDALCIPSHKSLYGIQGVGAVLFSENALNHGLSCTLIEGGSGTNSKDILMPSFLPDRFEAGTMPTPAVAALAEGVKFVITNKPSSIRSHEEYLAGSLKNRLCQLKNIIIYEKELNSGIVLFNLFGKSSTFVANELSLESICVRAGFHCAPFAHKKIKTDESGAVRISFGVFNDLKDVIKVSDVIWKISKKCKL